MACAERGITRMEWLANLDKRVGRWPLRFIGFPLKIPAAPRAQSAPSRLSNKEQQWQTQPRWRPHHYEVHGTGQPSC